MSEQEVTVELFEPQCQAIINLGKLIFGEEIFNSDEAWVEFIEHAPKPSADLASAVVAVLSEYEYQIKH